MPPPIPREQIERIEPIVEALLTELRQRTQALTAETDLPLQFEPEAGA